MKKYYLLGICGISMSSLAVMLKLNGDTVAGYDENLSNTAQILKKYDIKVDLNLDLQAVKDADVVVVSSAFKTENPILQKVKCANVHLMTRGQLLGKIAKGYEKVIAVAGSHGKTTTTAMIYEILKVAGFNPTLHLGGQRIEDNLNFEIGDKKFFVTEACEYYDNFLNLVPYICVVTNIEKEHMDYFKTFENQKKSFKKFKHQSQFVFDTTCGFEAKNLCHNHNGDLSFDLFENRAKIMHLNLQICEEINTQNCIFAYQVAHFLGIDDEKIKQGLENFKGVKTRFERMKSQLFPLVVCDYAHHPTEIEKAISSAQRIYSDKDIIVVFQPHTFSRTKTLLQEFVQVFSSVTNPVFFKTYSAREKETDGTTAEELAEIVKKNNKNTQYFDNFADLQKYLMTFDKNSTMLLFVGAGDLPSILHKNNFVT